MKRVIGLIVGLVATFGLTGTATAAYPVGTPTITTSSSSPTSGAPVTLTASGFCPNANVVFTSGGQTLGQATANAGGTATLTINAPATAGTFNVTATATGDCIAVASLSIAVTAPGNIPVTGSDTTSGGLQIGAIAIGAGAALMGLAAFRRRRLVAA